MDMTVKTTTKPLKINKKLKIYFDNLDGNIEPIDELKVGQKIKEILETKGKKISNKYDIAEHIAFQFLPNYQNKSGNWGTYYGPMFVLPGIVINPGPLRNLLTTDSIALVINRI